VDVKRVLVVDDNKDAAFSLGLVLEAAGFQVETCLDGETALDVADRFSPDACLLDINMPGMDGYELARQLVEKSPDNPPLLASVTGFDDYLHMRQAADAGFNLHFTKPADPGDVVEQLGDCIRPRT
jgi:two-component system, OmpR family, response regulator